MGDKVKLPPISTTEKQMVSTSKKLSIMSPNVPSVPLIPACDSLSQPSGEGRVVVKEAWEVWEGWTGSGSLDSLRKQSK